MFAKIKSKWVLIVIGVLLIILIIVAVLAGGKNQTEEAVAPDQTATTDEPIDPGQLPRGDGETPFGSAWPATSATASSVKSATALASKSSTPIAIVTPSPTQSVGSFDWTKQPAGTRPIPSSNSVNRAIDPCKVAGISDNWDDPFAKTMCGLIRFVGQQIFEPLDTFLCQLEASNYASNLSSNIKGRYIGGVCLIEDR